MEDEVTVQQFVIVDDKNCSIESLSQKTNVYRIRKYLLILLVIIFTFNLFYVIFVSSLCINYVNSWFCQRFNHSYEFLWSLISLIYDSLWLLVTYRYYSKGLLFFAWFSTILLFIFIAFLVMALFTIFRTMIYFHMIPIHILIASISSIIICIGTLILQVIIIFFSFKLSKLLKKKKIINNSTT